MRRPAFLCKSAGLHPSGWPRAGNHPADGRPPWRTPDATKGAAGAPVAWDSDLAAGPSPPWGGLLLLRRDHHDHLPAFKARARFDHDVLAEVTLDPGGHLPAQLLVAHLAATEADVHLDLVAFLQEAAHVAQLDLVVALVGHRAELHFLDLDLAGLLLGLVGLLLHFELELAEVHDLADRRIRVRLDLDQVKAFLFGKAQGLVARQDADHLAIGSDHAHARDSDLLVLPVLFLGGADIPVSGGCLGRGGRGRHGLSVLRRLLRTQGIGEVGHRHCAQIFAGTRTHRHRAILLLAVSDHQQVWHALQRVLADLKADLLVPQIGLDAEALICKDFPDFVHVFSLGVGDVHHHGLDRGQPGGELAGVVLDQDADEALHGADDRAVQHDRVPTLAVLVHVFGAEAAGHHEVHLHGAQLPGAADGVLEVVFDLRAVEGALARQLLPLHAGGA